MPNLCTLTDRPRPAVKWRQVASVFAVELRSIRSSVLLLMLVCAPVHLLAQTPVTTWHYNNARTSANTSEFLLTPSNVNVSSFGELFSQPVDGFIVGHPLYLPGINIVGQGMHNVVFVATMHDTLYAFDSDNPNSPPLWVTSILTYSPPGATSVPATVQRNGPTTGWTEVGIISTPVIDPASGTLYLVAETYENGSVVHRLHAFDVTSGLEKLGGPTTITATYTLNGTTSTFRDLYQINRPGLLLVNGHIYIAFGSNCCNAYSQGWVMSYNASTLQQEGVFDAEPGKTLASIWQKGAALSADSYGNIYAETGEGFYAPGTNLSTSVLKLSQIGPTLSLNDWFTPYNHQYLSAQDLDLAEGVLILPDQPGPYTHELIAIGKEGTVYVLNRDNMGQLCSACTAGDTQIVQKLPTAVGSESGTPVFWNNTVYFTGTNVPVMAFTMKNGLLTGLPSAQSIKMGNGGHALITANGNSNGILWEISGGVLRAMNALTLQILYTSQQAANSRDKLPPLAHFATPIVADGKLFVGTQNSLVVYGLFPALSVVAGSGQSAAVASTLPLPLTVQVADSYTQTVVSGLTVSFSDGGKGGSFNPSTVVTDSTGSAATSYTLPTKAGSYKLTASATRGAQVLFTETALPGPVKTLSRTGKYSQSGPVATPLAAPLVAKAVDAYLNPVPGVSVSYSDKGAGGSFSMNPVTTDNSGQAAVTYTTPTTAAIVKIFATTAAGVSAFTFVETVTPGPVANVATTSGDNQSAVAGSQLASPLVVTVTDQYGNKISGVSVNFADGGAGGTFSSNPVLTVNGLASVNYVTPSNAGTVNIQATVNGVLTTTGFTVTVQ